MARRAQLFTRGVFNLEQRFEAFRVWLRMGGGGVVKFVGVKHRARRLAEGRALEDRPPGAKAALGPGDAETHRPQAGLAARAAAGQPLGRVALLVPRESIGAVVSGATSAAQVGRETGIGVGTIRARVMAAKREGVTSCKRPLAPDSRKGSKDE